MSYVRNAWYVAAWSHELTANRLFATFILNQPIVVWRNAAGELSALEDRCVHRLAPLSLGRCEGEKLRCMYHGILYDRSGRIVEIPGQERVPSGVKLRSYPAVERHGWAWIWMGHAPADEASIPPLLGIDHPDYVSFHGQLDYAAEARFVNDNLLDLSHVGFLHAQTFGFSDIWGRERPEVTELGKSVRSERWIKSEGKLGILEEAEPRVDTYVCYDFFVPGILTFIAEAFPCGSADALKGRSPTLDKLPEAFAVHAVTPLTEKTARYFYMNGTRRHGNESIYDPVARRTTENAFAEDKKMIEAQQRNIDATPGWRFVPTTADHGIILFNRLLERLCREESVDRPMADAQSPHSAQGREQPCP